MDAWTTHDLFLNEHLIKEDDALINAFNARIADDLPEIEVSPTQGKLLYLLAKIKNAKRILEIGTFCAYSTIWLAKALPDKSGIVITIESSKRLVDIAQKNIAFANMSNKINIKYGEATDIINEMISNKTEPFDMIFIDADKPRYSIYLNLVQQLSKPGTIICTDNIIINGELCNMENTKPKASGLRKFIKNLGNKDSIESTAIQTVGKKGYDGFTISVVK